MFSAYRTIDDVEPPFDPGFGDFPMLTHGTAGDSDRPDGLAVAFERVAAAEDHDHGSEPSTVHAVLGDEGPLAVGDGDHRRIVDLLVRVELTGEYARSSVVTANSVLTLWKKQTGIG